MERPETDFLKIIVAVLAWNLQTAYHLGGVSFSLNIYEHDSHYT